MDRRRRTDAIYYRASTPSDARSHCGQTAKVPPHLRHRSTWTSLWHVAWVNSVHVICEYMSTACVFKQHLFGYLCYTTRLLQHGLGRQFGSIGPLAAITPAFRGMAQIRTGLGPPQIWCHLCLQQIPVDDHDISLSVVVEQSEAQLSCAFTVAPSGQRVVVFCPTCSVRAILPDGSTLLRLAAVEENSSP